MFKRISYTGMVNGFHGFDIEDSDFRATVSHRTYYHGMCVSGIMGEYERRKLPVAKNVACFYLYMVDHYLTYKQNLSLRIEEDRVGVLKYHPEYAKYYRCLFNQIRQIGFGRYAPSTLQLPSS